VRDDNRDLAACSQFVGEYRDSYLRCGGAWRISAQRYILFGEVRGRYAAEAHLDYVAAAGTSPD
jgi:hypothetical protein